MQEERPPLDYQSPGDQTPDPRRPEDSGKWRRFAAGIGVGTGVSALLWIGVFNTPSNTWLYGVLMLACIIVPGTKLAVATSLMSRPDSRAFGAGLLASFATGFLILFGTCAATMSRAQ
jgi:hypothetical protein